MVRTFKAITFTLSFVITFIFFLSTTLTAKATIPEQPYIARIIYDFDYDDTRDFLKMPQITEIEQLAGVNGRESIFLFDRLSIEIDEGFEIGYYDSIGVSQPHFAYFAGGFAELIEGRTFSEEECSTYTPGQVIPVIVPKSIAEYEDFKTGSTFNLNNGYYAYQELAEKTKIQEPFRSENYQFEVIGIFEAETIYSSLSMDGYLETSFLMPHSFIKHANEFYIKAWNDYRVQYEGATPFHSNEANLENNDCLSIAFTLDNSIHLETFKKEANQILGPGYEVLILPSSNH